MSRAHRGESSQSVLSSWPVDFLWAHQGTGVCWNLISRAQQTEFFLSWRFSGDWKVLKFSIKSLLMPQDVACAKIISLQGFQGFTVCPRVYRYHQLPSNIPFEVCMLIRCDVWNFLYNFCSEIISYFLSAQEAIEGLILATKLCLIILMCSGKYWNSFDMINIYFLLLHKKKTKKKPFHPFEAGVMNLIRNLEASRQLLITHFLYVI